jgi:phosphohistidine phosphatase
MILYIIRHAWAGQFGDPAWPDDFERPLTVEGRRRFARMIELLAPRGFSPEVVATSPLVRCRQTAEIVAGAVSGSPEVVELDGLAPSSDLEALLAWTNGPVVAGFDQVAWVGHAPDVGRLAAALIAERGGWVRFAKGAAAAIGFDGPVEPGEGELRWLVTAKVLGC